MPDDLNKSQRNEVESLCERLFDADPDELERVLDRECDDAQVRGVVRRLLKGARHDSGGTRNAEDLLRSMGSEEEIANGPSLEGTYIDRYRIEAVLGRGGFGVVYRATQTSPVERTVAIKIIRPGYGSPEVAARFESERQALAMMDHPNIARVYDAGALPDGRPYFVMELVRGVPITRHCTENNLGASDRLDLFVKVCQAVAHAHAKGVIHRDLKPGNVLVTEDSGRPVVIDFGIAKALERRLTEETIATQHGMLIGTPEYMSPEQTGLNPGTADTRSDVYSLGVLLYELLTGRLPFDRDRLKKADLMTLQRIIKEEVPPKPSTRLSTHASNEGVDATTGRTPVPYRQVTGDLDWIVMRCLEKDPGRRYPTAEALVADIRRYRNNEPVEAGPPSVRYRLGKFIKRHRVPLVAGLLVAVSLIGGLAASLVFASGQARERALAEQRREDLEQVAAYQASVIEGLDAASFGVSMREGLRLGLEATLDRESLNATEADEIRAGFGEALDRINAADVSRTALASSYLATAAGRIGKEFRDRPILEATLRASFGEAYASLGLRSPAIEQFERALELRQAALGDDDPDTLHTLARLESQRLGEGETGVTERLRAAFEQAASLHGESADITRFLAWALGQALIRIDNDEAERLLLLASADAEDSGELRLSVLGSLVELYNELDRPEDAERVVSQLIEELESSVGPDASETLAARNTLGNVLRRRDRNQEALEQFKAAYSGASQTLGETHPDTLTYAYGVARVLYNSGELDQAIALGRRVYKDRLETLGPSHPETAASAIQVAFWASGDERERAFRNAADAYRRVYGPDHPYVIGAMMNVGITLKLMGRFDEAAEILVGVLEARLRVYEKDHPEVLTARYQYGSCLRAGGRSAMAREQLELAYSGFNTSLGQGNYSAQTVAYDLGMLHKDEDESLALQYFDGVLDALRPTVGPCHGLYRASLQQCIAILLVQDRESEARARFKSSLTAIGGTESDRQLSACIEQYEAIYRPLAESGPDPAIESMLNAMRNGDDSVKKD